MASSRSVPIWQPGEIKALRKQIKAMPLDKKPSPRMLEIVRLLSAAKKPKQ